MNTTTGTVSHTERRNSSKYGNPRYLVHLTDGRAYLTEVNTSWAYAATNSEYRKGLVEFHLTNHNPPHIRYGEVIAANPVR